MNWLNLTLNNPKEPCKMVIKLKQEDVTLDDYMLVDYVPGDCYDNCTITDVDGSTVSFKELFDPDKTKIDMKDAVFINLDEVL